MQTTTTHRGREIEILARDSDPRCDVWIAYLDNPDQDAWVSPSELVTTTTRR